MGQKLSENELELYRRIDEVLHYMWDPIGVAGIPGARDEYYSYIPEVFRLAKLKNTESDISVYLNGIQSKNMELRSDMARCTEIAKIVKDWSKTLELEASM